MGDLVLEGLVFVVLLDLVELDLQVVDLGLDALERVLVLLDVHLGVLERLAGGLQLGLAVARAAWRAASVLGPEAEAVAQRPWRVDATGGGRGDFRRWRASVAAPSSAGF